MAIEIRELIIKATVVPEGSANATSQSATSGNGSVSQKEEIITTCVEKIIEILKEKNDR